MTPSDFRNTVILKDDSLETTAVLSTINGFQEKQGLLGMVNSDVFIRAFIDKRTKITRYQIYGLANYTGDWCFYESVNYETPDGPKSTGLTTISRDVGTCYQYIGCIHTEQFTFSVDESFLRAIASKYQPNVPNAWRMRFKSKAGADWNEAMMPAEVQGALEAVAAYQARSN